MFSMEVWDDSFTALFTTPVTNSCVLTFYCQINESLDLATQLGLSRHTTVCEEDKIKSWVA